MAYIGIIYNFVHNFVDQVVKKSHVHPIQHFPSVAWTCSGNVLSASAPLCCDISRYHMICIRQWSIEGSTCILPSTHVHPPTPPAPTRHPHPPPSNKLDDQLVSVAK